MAATAWRSSEMNWSKCLSIFSIRFLSAAGIGSARSSATACSAFASDCGRMTISSAELCGTFSSAFVSFSVVQISCACFAQSLRFTSAAGSAGAGLCGGVGGSGSSPGDPENANANAAMPSRASTAVGMRTRSRRFDFMCSLSARARAS